MNPQLLKDLLWGFFFLIIQVVLVRHLRVFGTEANILWLYLIFIASTKSRTYAIVFAAIFSFCLDALLDVWGLYLFSHVLIIFLTANFIPKVNEVKLLTAQVLTVLMGLSFLSNVVFFGMSSVFSLFDSNVHFWTSLIGNTIYTTVLGTFFYNFSSAAQGNT